MWRTLPGLTVVQLLSLSVAIAQAAPMDTWEITVESGIPLSTDIRKGIEGAAEYIIREVIPEWWECYPIQCLCHVMEQQEEIYRVTMAIHAEHTNGEAIYAKVLFEYDAQSGGYVIKEGGSKPTTTDNEVPPSTNATIRTKPTSDDEPSNVTTSPSSRTGVSLWSKFELDRETEKGVKDAAKQLVEERINVEELGGVAVDCFVLKSEGGWYTIYSRIFGRPPPGSPEASEGKAKTWEVAFRYNMAQGTCEATSFSEVDSFLVPEDVKQKAVTIGEGDAEIKAFVTENAENNLTSRAEWINRNEGMVRLEYAAALLLNETHGLYKGLTAYIDVEGEEVLYTQMDQGVWYAPGLRGAPEPGETGTPPPATTTDVATSTPVEYYYGLGAILTVAIAVATAILFVTKKTKS